MAILVNKIWIKSLSANPMMLQAKFGRHLSCTYRDVIWKCEVFHYKSTKDYGCHTNPKNEIWFQFCKASSEMLFEFFSCWLPWWPYWIVVWYYFYLNFIMYCMPHCHISSISLWACLAAVTIKMTTDWHSENHCSPNSINFPLIPTMVSSIFRGAVNFLFSKWHPWWPYWLWE